MGGGGAGRDRERQRHRDSDRERQTERCNIKNGRNAKKEKKRLPKSDANLSFFNILFKTLKMLYVQSYIFL